MHLIRAVGVKEIHVRITSPPLIAPCYYGIDIPTRHELIASAKSVDEICQYIGADTLGYLSLDAVLKSVEDRNQYCNACFSDNYPTNIATNDEKQRSLFPEQDQSPDK
jgi:amidophosphoribosyltransferase